jgi:hypothetical protein
MASLLNKWMMYCVQNILNQFDEGFNKTGHYCAMYVGFDSQGNLLEVKVKFTLSTTASNDNIHVFHADKATKKYQRLFNQSKGKRK